MRGFVGGYDTVRRFVQPLRTAEALAERPSVRFETPPGQQSQIDWGSARVHFRHQPVVLHMFILTLSYSRRHFFAPTPDERVSQLLSSHERAFGHFGAHTRERLYDRPRTISVARTLVKQDGQRVPHYSALGASAASTSARRAHCHPWNASRQA